jgi:hypothetical protein
LFSPIEEIYFWSGIMRDHAEFLYTALSPSEKELIQETTQFYNQWNTIHQEAERLLEMTVLEQDQLVNKVLPLLKRFIDFKQMIVTKQLTGEVRISFTPSFVNHMLNEANEFYRNLLFSFTSSTNNEETALLLHKIWLRDAAGHAASIASDLDPVESILIKEAQDFKKRFDHLFIKAFELDQMIERTKLRYEPALRYFNQQVEDVMVDFIDYLERVKDLRSDYKALGAIHPSIPDHMIREESYYLTKLKMTR